MKLKRSRICSTNLHGVVAGQVLNPNLHKFICQQMSSEICLRSLLLVWKVVAMKPSVVGQTLLLALMQSSKNSPMLQRDAVAYGQP